MTYLDFIGNEAKEKTKSRLCKHLAIKHSQVIDVSFFQMIKFYLQMFDVNDSWIDRDWFTLMAGL